MSNDSELEEIRQSMRVSQELLFLVLDQIDEPVRLDIEESKTKLGGDKVIDIQLDEDANQWVLQVVNLDG